MKRDLHNDSFESFLKQNADELSMRPSATVWKRISKKLHPRKRWLGFGFGALLVSFSLLAYYSTNHNTAVPVPGKTAATDQKAIKNTALPTTQPTDNSSLNNHTTLVSTTQPAKPTAGILSTLNGGLSATDHVPTGPSGERVFSEVVLSPALPMAGMGLYNSLQKKPFTAITPTDNSIMDNTVPANTTAAIKKAGKNRKFSMQVTFTPNISYRKFSENKLAGTTAASGAPYNFRPSSAYNINNMVTHKPNMGLQVGLVTKYALSKNIALRSGLQFNMNRYEVKASNNYVPELTTIALNSRYLPDSVNTMSSYRNYNGYGSDWLQNLYFQLSVPVGLEVNLHSDSRMQFGIASTIQPTYVFGDRVYLLTTDYKNYAQMPWLVRRWNVNTSFETFVSYSSGHIKWQVGPQVRYQLLSSFINKYPFKENLFDFGLRVGVSLNNNH